MRKQVKALIATGTVVSLGLAAVPAIISATGVSGTVRLNAEVATAIAMKIASPNDTNPDCMEQSGITYGVANRYATSNGAEGSKQVDGFDGTEGGADELNTNTSCATLTMDPNAFSSTYSDITIYTNSPNGYSLTVRSADNTSPNLVNTTDSTQYIPAAALTEVDGTGEQAGQKVVPGGQNKWALKSDTGLLDTWTPVATADTTVRAYDQETHNGSNTRVTYGISSGNNPTGKYATTLTYTATMFDGDNPSVPSIIPATVSGLSFDTNKLKIPYGATRTITITPAAGHYLASLTCSNGFTCVDENGDPIETGTSATASQIVYVTNNSVKTGSGTIEATAGTSEYTISASATNATVSASSLSIPYGSSKTLTVTPNTGYYLSSFSCPEGYSCTKEDGSAIATGDNATAQTAQTIKVTNNNTTSGGSLTFTGALRNLTVAITPSIAASTDTNSLSVPYGGSKTFTITPVAGYYLTGVTCSSGYTCTGYSTGSAADPNATSRGTQTITVTNNSATSTGAVSFTLDNKYRISFSKTNISSPSEDYVDIAYGGSATVTVTPASGYYLSGVTCPEGFTCTGYTTDKSDSASAAAQTITVTNNDTNTTGTLAFAVTKLAVPLSDLTTMQQMTPDTVAETAVGASKTLTDTRGGSYTVAKLADGNIWMTQDLKLGGSSALTLTPDDSDVTSNYTLPAENTGTWCTSADAACYNQSLMRKTGAPNGYLYNWYAATAGTGVYGTGAGVNATASICPKGWKLPTGGPSGQFVALDQAYGGDGTNRTDATQRNKFMAAPLNFNYTGYVKGGSVGDPSDGVYYWSRTAYSKTRAYNLNFNSSGGFLPQYFNYEYRGFAVRCVAS